VKKIGHLVNIGTDGGNIKMDLKEVGWEGVDWIHLAQNNHEWRALLNTVMNFAFHAMLGIA
jgi:hypothetical protein